MGNGRSRPSNSRKTSLTTALCGTRSLTLSPFVIVLALRSAEFLGEPDEKPFGPADVAEPIRIFVLNDFAYRLRAAIAEPFKRLVDVVDGEHATIGREWAGRVTGLGDQRVEIAMMRTPDGHGRLELSRFLTPPPAADHRNAPVNALGYLRVMPFELKPELAKEINRPPEVIDDNSYVVHPFERHVANLEGVA